ISTCTKDLQRFDELVDMLLIHLPAIEPFGKALQRCAALARPFNWSDVIELKKTLGNPSGEILSSDVVLEIYREFMPPRTALNVPPGREALFWAVDNLACQNISANGTHPIIPFITELKRHLPGTGIEKRIEQWLAPRGAGLRQTDSARMQLNI